MIDSLRISAKLGGDVEIRGGSLFECIVESDLAHTLEKLYPFEGKKRAMRK